MLMKPFDCKIWKIRRDVEAQAPLPDSIFPTNFAHQGDSE